MTAPCNLQLTTEFVEACTWVDNEDGRVLSNLIYLTSAMLNGAWADFGEDVDENGKPQTSYFVSTIDRLEEMGWREKVQPWLDPEPWDEARMAAHLVSIALSPEPE